MYSGCGGDYQKAERRLWSVSEEEDDVDRENGNGSGRQGRESGDPDQRSKGGNGQKPARDKAWRVFGRRVLIEHDQVIPLGLAKGKSSDLLFKRGFTKSGHSH